MTQTTHAAFDGHTCVAQGDLISVAHAAQTWAADKTINPPLIFDLNSGHLVDVDLRGNADDITAWLQEHLPHALPQPAKRGRPKLGVVSREVTLLPKQWAWLNQQSGGASATLRRLVSAASKDPKAEVAQTQLRTNRLANALAGDLPGFEEAMRALYAGDEQKFTEVIAVWPVDVRAVCQTCATGAWI